jgi:hypothetical protein
MKVALWRASGSSLSLLASLGERVSSMLIDLSSSLIMREETRRRNLNALTRAWSVLHPWLALPYCYLGSKSLIILSFFFIFFRSFRNGSQWNPSSEKLVDFGAGRSCHHPDRVAGRNNDRWKRERWPYVGAPTPHYKPRPPRAYLSSSQRFTDTSNTGLHLAACPLRHFSFSANRKEQEGKEIWHSFASFSHAHAALSRCAVKR